MKRHYILPILFILCICTAVSCQKTEPPVSPRFQLPTISSDVVYPVEDRGADAAFGGKCFYYLSASSSEVRALDLYTGEDWVLTNTLASPALLAADGDEVCVYDESDSLIHRFSHEGSEIGVYIPPEPPEHGWKYKRMAVFHGTVVISSDLHLWIIDGGTGNITEADLTDCEFREIVHPFVADCDTIYFVGSMGNASYNNTLYKCTGEGIVNEKWTEAVFQAFCMMEMKLSLKTACSFLDWNTESTLFLRQLILITAWETVSPCAWPFRRIRWQSNGSALPIKSLYIRSQ